MEIRVGDFDVVYEAEEWLRATDPRRSNPAILIKSLVVRIKQLEAMLDEAEEHVQYLESRLDRMS